MANGRTALAAGNGAAARLGVPPTRQRRQAREEPMSADVWAAADNAD